MSLPFVVWLMGVPSTVLAVLWLVGIFQKSNCI
jgi:hypothetical protein